MSSSPRTPPTNSIPPTTLNNQTTTIPFLPNSNTLLPPILQSLKPCDSPSSLPALTRSSTRSIILAPPPHTAHQSRTPPQSPAPPVKTAEKWPSSFSLLSLPHIPKSPQTRTNSSAKQPLIMSSPTHKSSYPLADTSTFNIIVPQNVSTLNSGSEISNCMFQLSKVDYAGFVEKFFSLLFPSRDPDHLNVVLNAILKFTTSDENKLAIITFLQQTKTYEGKQLPVLFSFIPVLQ
eukprot:TRINITY_DN2649_c0_g1_i1.p1 TRINITY_DN2649_c0_g1~~TRINITY_DN2649_c0_g1_i1.p1  ORF type:complete len:234 (-),score=14.72 TRINITY_DN2649_c0_g1_i1:106-807(-)